MQYMGSKNRISKELVPIIQNYITENTVGYIEPFVGGANMIDKIKCKNKIGCDIHPQLIALLQHVQERIDDLPNTIDEETYNTIKSNQKLYEDWYLGLVGFCCAYANIYFGGYARGNDNRDRPGEAIRNIKNNLID